MVVIFGSEQLTSGKVKESTKTVGKNTNGGCGLGPGGTHNQCSPKQSGKALSSS